MKKVYINDFVEDLNYSGVMLCLSGDIDLLDLQKKLNKDHVGHMERFKNVCGNGLMSIENGDLEVVEASEELYHHVRYYRGTILRLCQDIGGFYIAVPRVISEGD